jgi:hypothetical protein
VAGHRNREPRETLKPATEHGYDSPEEAGRGDIPKQFVTLLGVRVEGDRACVWTLTNDRPPFEGEELFLIRKGSKWFPADGAGGFSDSTPAYILEKAVQLGYRGGQT